MKPWSISRRLRDLLEDNLPLSRWAAVRQHEFLRLLRAGGNQSCDRNPHADPRHFPSAVVVAQQRVVGNLGIVESARVVGGEHTVLVPGMHADCSVNFRDTIA